jgi:hypothetical protein
MTLTIKQTLEDGAVVLVDDVDGAEFVVKPGVWESLTGLPASEQRHRVELFVLEHRADPTGGRSETDEQAMDAASQGQGEAHQDRSD